MKFINVCEEHAPYDVEKSHNGGSYYQPTWTAETEDGKKLIIEDLSCGDFGSRIYVDYDGRRAAYGSMLDASECYSEFTSSDMEVLEAIWDATGYCVPINEELE